jgi:hypothetical protein
MRKAISAENAKYGRGLPFFDTKLSIDRQNMMFVTIHCDLHELITEGKSHV